jgi:hypothetical protein
MAIDDYPVDALEKQLQLEDVHVSPVRNAVLAVMSTLPSFWPLDKITAAIKDHLSADSLDRIRLLVQTLASELRMHDADITVLKQASNAEQLRMREELANELVIDAARKAEATRAKERVRRIGLILANGITEHKAIDADEIEEMMRIAVELSDRDLDFLRELIRIEGDALKTQEHIPRYDAHVKWQQGRWADRVDSQIDSVFSKLESYGLVARIAPPNSMNIMTDYQNRYVLLKKGARFDVLIRGATGV